MVGAYYSNQGAMIHSGAAGLGASRGGPLRAYQDGSLGAGGGPLMAFQDGSLGAGPLMAFEDGSLGMSEEPVNFLSGMGEYFAPNGMGEYFAPQGVGGCNACGDVAGEVVLDMKNPDVVREVKTAMGAAPWMIAKISGPAQEVEFDEDFFENPIWDADATRFATFYKEGLKAADPAKAVLVDSMFKAPNLTPTAFGITNILSVIGYPGATALKGTLPALTAFFDQTSSTGGSPAKTGKVNPPFLSVAEQQRGAFPIKASTIALIGAGVLAITAILLMSKKKR